MMEPMVYDTLALIQFDSYLRRTELSFEQTLLVLTGLLLVLSAMACFSVSRLLRQVRQDELIKRVTEWS